MLAQIPAPPGNAIDLGPLTINYYGMLIALGVLAAIFLARRRYASFGGNPDHIDAAGLVGLVAGLIGARLGYVIWRLDAFADRPLGVFAIWEGGLVLFGGLLAGVAAGLLVARRKRMDIPAATDAVAPAIPLAQAIGRWGNYFNQELYGRPTDLPWALEVDPGHRVAGFEEYATFHPTFLYESLLNIVLVIVLLAISRTQRLARGALLFAYLAGYGAIRFSVELLRIDTDLRILGLSRNNWAFLAVFLLGVAGMIWWQRRAAARPRTKSGRR